MTTKENEIPNFSKIYSVTEDFEKLDTSFYDISRYFKSERIICKRKPNTPGGIAKYWISILRDTPSGEMEKYLGHVRLTKLTSDVTTLEVQYVGGQGYRDLFDRLLDNWRKHYESYETIADVVNRRKDVPINKGDAVEALATKSTLSVDLTERQQKLNRLAVLWARLNQLGKEKGYNLSVFLNDHIGEVDLYNVGESEFKKHLPKAYKWGVIDKNPKTGRFIPKIGN